MGLNQKLRKLDVFKKVPKDLSEGTNIGGCISIIALFLMSYFTVSQILIFLNPPTSSRISYDTPFTRKPMTINLDIEFPRFPCEIISLDLQDVMMSHSPNIASVKKWRLNSSGNYIDSSDFELLRETDQVKQYNLAKEAFQKNYGCRLIGSFTVKQVPGNFHISSHAYQNIYMRLAVDGIISTLDVSHKIHKLYFGDSWSTQEIQKYHKQAQLLCLDGHSRIYDMTKTPHSYTSHYHLDIVPTQYADRFVSTETYQYTYNHNTFQVSHMPSLYFNYHIGGLQVYVYPQNSRITSFFLQMFAIIGGIYAIASFMDNMAFQIWGSKHTYQLIQ